MCTNAYAAYYTISLSMNGSGFIGSPLTNMPPKLARYLVSRAEREINMHHWQQLNWDYFALADVLSIKHCVLSAA